MERTAMDGMVLLSRKSLLAVAAVIDVAVHGQDRPVSAKALAARHSLPARHLEPVLQALPDRIVNVHASDLAERDSSGLPRYTGLRAVADFDPALIISSSTSRAISARRSRPRPAGSSRAVGRYGSEKLCT